MYLLDTDTLVFALHGHPGVLRNIRDHVGDPAAVSVISYGELLYGAAKSNHPLENIASVRGLMERFPVVDVTPAVMEVFASLKAKLEAPGKRIDDFDLLIASTALSLGSAVVTNNVRHFRSVPHLAVESWATYQ